MVFIAFNAYRSIRCKINNLQAARLLILHQTKLSTLRKEDNNNLLNNLNTTHLFKPYRYSYQMVDRLPVKAGRDEVRQVADHLASNGIHLAV